VTGCSLASIIQVACTFAWVASGQSEPWTDTYHQCWVEWTLARWQPCTSSRASISNLQQRQQCRCCGGEPCAKTSLSCRILPGQPHVCRYLCVSHTTSVSTHSMDPHPHACAGCVTLHLPALMPPVQNLCADRSHAQKMHSAIGMYTDSGHEGNAELRDCVLETVQGSAVFHVSAVLGLLSCHKGVRCCALHVFSNTGCHVQHNPVCYLIAGNRWSGQADPVHCA
jgi:hypothetical protein